jgi:hypothetical protein
VNYAASYDGWDSERWAKLVDGDVAAANAAAREFHGDVERTTRQYANQLQIRTHHYFLLQMSGVTPENVEGGAPQALSPYPQNLIESLDAAEAAVRLAQAETEAYFKAVDAKRRETKEG